MQKDHSTQKMNLKAGDGFYEQTIVGHETNIYEQTRKRPP